LIYRRILILGTLLACASISAAELEPRTAAAFDRYVKAAEDEMNAHRAAGDFLWLDRHPDKKSVVWLGQPSVVPIETLDHGQAIDVPGGDVQHWLGAVYLDRATLDTARNSILNINAYKDFFKQVIIDSKLVKPNGYQFELQLRLYKKQLSAVMLNVNASCNYSLIDAEHVFIACHSTHIGEVEHPKNKKAWDKERPASDESGYLWRLNYYWRIAAADNGVYVEFETISLGRGAGGRFNPGRVLNGFQNYPRELTQGVIDGMLNLFPNRR
jgi:hypothetical protein